MKNLCKLGNNDVENSIYDVENSIYDVENSIYDVENSIVLPLTLLI